VKPEPSLTSDRKQPPRLAVEEDVSPGLIHDRTTHEGDSLEDLSETLPRSNILKNDLDVGIHPTLPYFRHVSPPQAENAFPGQNGLIARNMLPTSYYSPWMESSEDVRIPPVNQSVGNKRKRRTSLSTDLQQGTETDGHTQTKLDSTSDITTRHRLDPRPSRRRQERIPTSAGLESSFDHTHDWSNTDMRPGFAGDTDEDDDRDSSGMEAYGHATGTSKPRIATSVGTGNGRKKRVILARRNDNLPKVAIPASTPSGASLAPSAIATPRPPNPTATHTNALSGAAPVNITSKRLPVRPPQNGHKDALMRGDSGIRGRLSQKRQSMTRHTP
jgi:hypothetical protein